MNLKTVLSDKARAKYFSYFASYSYASTIDEIFETYINGLFEYFTILLN